MELSQIKALAQCLFGVLTHVQERQLSCFVCGGLAGPHHITLNFPRDFLGRHAGLRDHVLDSVFPAPLFGMHTGIDHQPDGSEHFGLQAT